MAHSADDDIRILHAFDHSLPIQSGYSFRSAAILREQRARGWKTVQLTSSKQGPISTVRERTEEFEFYRTPAPRGKWASLPFLNELTAIWHMRKRLREVAAIEQPDIIHAHSPCLVGLAALGLGLPIVYELRSSWEDAAVSTGKTTAGSIRYRLSRALETHVLRRADAITTICKGLHDDIVTRGIPAERVTIVPNGGDAERLGSRATGDPDIRRRYGLDGTVVLGFIGSFFAWEGLPLLIEALATIRRVRGDVRLLLVGTGPDQTAVLDAVRRFEVDDIVVLTGQVPQTEAEALYEAIDVLVFPRLPMRLTDLVTPLKPLEAMAMSKLCVASDVGGHRDLIEDGRTGLLFKAGDAGALARTVLGVFSAPERHKQIAAEATRFVRKQRTWAGSVAAYEGVYRRLLATAGRQRR